MFPLSAILDVGMKLVDKFFPDPEARAKAQLELLEMQQNGELAKINADIAEQQELTKRWQADLSSDSWLAKNIRPMTLIFILLAYSFFALMSMLGYETRGAYVELLGQWGMLVMTAYFGGRSLEKIMAMKDKSKVDETEIRDATK
jgi:Holin of 3TMs, for gene-transfer release